MIACISSTLALASSALMLPASPASSWRTRAGSAQPATFLTSTNLLAHVLAGGDLLDHLALDHLDHAGRLLMREAGLLQPADRVGGVHRSCFRCSRAFTVTQTLLCM